jgi:hypothetical protein
MRSLLLLALPLALAACATPTEQHAATCASYGFTRDDPRFPECVMAVEQQQQERAAAAWMALGAMGNAMQAREAAQQAPMQHLNCSTIGNQTTCW